MKLLVTIALALAAVLGLHAQGYIVPNGVIADYAGGLPGEISVMHDPTNGYYTGFYYTPQGKTLPTVFTNTFRFGAIVDVSVRVFLVSSNQPISQPAIQSGSYTELMLGNNYVFANNSPFYVGLYTGNMTFAPPNGIYVDPLFGWARLRNFQGAIQLLDSGLVYKAEGIYAGTLNIIPEPTSIALVILGGTFLGISRRNRTRE